MPGLNLKDVRRLPVSLPPKQEQEEVVKRVSVMLAFIEEIAHRLENAQLAGGILAQSILAKAFRGDLTSEWRKQNPDLIADDNSAEALLSRIKEVRKSVAPKKRTRTKRARR